ncbi:hypothetical protein EsH8_IV_001263 [Colletotrichum jinshuiense]
METLQADLFYEHDCNSETDRSQIQARENFARAAKTMIVKTQRAKLNLQGEKAYQKLDHDSSMPNLVRMGGEDPFSSSLNIICRHLTQLQLTAIIDKSFFWPNEDESIVWPNMESLQVKFSPVTPSGSWYFVGPRGEGKNVQGYPVNGVEYSGGSPNTENNTVIAHTPCQPSAWRIKPNPDTLYPLLTGFAKAAAQMPRLREAMIWAPIWWSPDGNDSSKFAYHKAYNMMNRGRPLGWGIGYTAPGPGQEDGVPESEDSDDEEVRLFEWRTGDWEPDETIRSLFHDIGREQHGEEFDDNWDPDANQEDLFFEGFCFGDQLEG